MIDTVAWAIAGYTVASVIFVAYLVSLWTRGRRADERLAAARRTAPESSRRTGRE